MITGPGIKIFGIFPTKMSGVLPSSSGTASPSVSPGRSGKPFSTCDGSVTNTALINPMASAIASSSHSRRGSSTFKELTILRHSSKPSSSFKIKLSSWLITNNRLLGSAW